LAVVKYPALRRGLADEVRYSIMPILIGDGISFFDGLDKDVALHLLEVIAYKSGMVALRYEVRKQGRRCRNKLRSSRPKRSSMTAADVPSGRTGRHRLVKTRLFKCEQARMAFRYRVRGGPHG
jgi:hypothetical protein